MSDSLTLEGDRGRRKWFGNLRIVERQLAGTVYLNGVPAKAKIQLASVLSDVGVIEIAVTHSGAPTEASNSRFLAMKGREAFPRSMTVHLTASNTNSPRAA